MKKRVELLVALLAGTVTKVANIGRGGVLRIPKEQSPTAAIGQVGLELRSEVSAGWAPAGIHEHMKGGGGKGHVRLFPLLCVPSAPLGQGRV